MINEIKNFVNSQINQEIGELARIRIPKEKLIDPFFELESFYIEILDSCQNELGWFVGWIEKQEDWFTFAYQINEETIDLQKRVPRVRELLRGNL